MGKAMRSSMPLRSCVFAAAVVALWSTTASGVGAQEPTRLLALLADADDAVTTAPAVRDALLQEAPAPIDDEDDYGELPEPTDAPTPTEAAAPTPTQPTQPTFAPTPTPPEQPTQVAAPTQDTETPTLAATANTNNAIANNASNLRGATANSVKPGLLIGFAVLCSAFLALWIRRRRDIGGADRGVDSGGGGGGSDMSDMATTSSTEKREDGGKKSQYSRLDNRAEEEQLLEDEFGGRGSWDDWENNQSQQRIDVRSAEDDEEDAEDEGNHRGTARLTKGLSSSSASSSRAAPQSPPPRSSTSVRTSTAGVKLTSPPSSGREDRGDRGGVGHLQNSMNSPPPRPTSVASDSSSTESFEVVVPPPIAPLDLLSGGVYPPPTAVAHHAEDTASTEDDLFSQFGLVPTFKKGVQQTPMAVASSPPPMRSTYTAPSTAALNPFAASPPLSSASLFAADMDDMELAGAATGAGVTEWGDDEEDDWVQGL